MWTNGRASAIPAISEFATDGLEVHWFLDDSEVLGQLGTVDWLQEWPAVSVALQLTKNHMTHLQILSARHVTLM